MSIQFWHDLYHGFKNGSEVCIYSCEGETRNIDLSKQNKSKSVTQSLRKHQHELGKQFDGNNLENQRVPKEQIDR